MIQLPRRSVTRFFIPLIDVLTLLFCIFLLMPIVKPAEGTPGADPEQLRRLEEELERLRREGGGLTPELQKELAHLREEQVKQLQQRLVIRVLEIDPKSGKLYATEPERVEVRNQADAQELIERDGRGPGTGSHQMYYLILYPRDRGSAYPLREQREEYERWFADVAHGWDIPGAGLVRGGKP